MQHVQLPACAASRVLLLPRLDPRYAANRLHHRTAWGPLPASHIHPHSAYTGVRAQALPLPKPRRTAVPTQAVHILDLACLFCWNVSLMAFMNASVLRYWSGVTFVVPCTQMARSLVILPDSMVSMTAASRSLQNSARAALLSSLAL